MITPKIKSFWKELPQSTAAELAQNILPILEEIKRCGINKMLTAYPNFFELLFKQIKKNNAAELFRQNPVAADLISDLLWEGIAGEVEKKSESQAILQKAPRKMRINIEASDSPFKNHFLVQEGKVKGGSGLLHFQDEDFRFMGPTDILIDLLLGELPLGFYSLQLQTAGHSGWLPRISPIIRQINKIIKAGEE